MNSLSIALGGAFTLVTLLFLYVVVNLARSSVTEMPHTSYIKIPALSLSESYLGERVPEYENANSYIQLGIPQENYSSFIYVK